MQVEKNPELFILCIVLWTPLFLLLLVFMD